MTSIIDLPTVGRSRTSLDTVWVVLKIGEFSAVCGVSTKRLRYYDEIGLFRPAWTDPASGYRFYSPAQLPELHQVVALRDLGVGLAEVADLVAGGVDLSTVLRRRRDELEAERVALQRRLAAIHVALDLDVHGDPIGVVTRRVEAQLVASLSAVLDPGDELEPLFDEIEAHVRDHDARAARPPALIVHHRTGPRARVEIVVPVTRPVPETGRVTNRTLDACQVASLIHRGGYDGLAEKRARLRTWIRQTARQPAGPPRIVYLQFTGDAALRLPAPFLAGSTAPFVTELQQPIT
jgi:DNA-binding transcriptional MerR regulator